jgi:hypothetical protein
VKDQRYDSGALARRNPDILDEDGCGTFYLSSAEDIMSSKLRWYQEGGSVSEQRWKDVPGILKVQGVKLDIAYLKNRASSLNLSDLLSRLLGDAGVAENM